MLSGKNLNKTCLNQNDEFRLHSIEWMLIVELLLFKFQVIVPSTGKRALDMMCGEWGASRCSPKKWFEFMGDAEGNLYVPFQITYITDPIVGYTPLSPLVVPCNQAINVSFKWKRALRFRFSKILQLYQICSPVSYEMTKWFLFRAFH